ncbi:CSC1-like protein At3g54510 [Linum perenne]
MKLDSLIASAAINFGLAFTILFLFSILKKQPSNSLIYYARPLSVSAAALPSFPQSISIYRFLPSLSWIRNAFHLSEDQILQIHGLDVLVLFRLFKFGINFFGFSSLLGLAVLVPVNYGGHEDDASKIRHYMDPFSISNVPTGSNRLWVHFTCLWLISIYGLFLLYKEYGMILNKRVHRLRILRPQPEQFTVLVRRVPYCSEHGAYGCAVDHFFSKYYPHSYCSCQMLYDAKEIRKIQKQANHISDKIKRLRDKSTIRKRGKASLLPHVSEEHEKITQHEEKLEELHNQIRELRSKDVLSGKELPVAFATFKNRRSASLAAQSQQHSHPLLWVTERAPEPRNVSWRSLAIPLRMLPFIKVAVVVLATLLTLFFAVIVTGVQGIAKFEKLKKWFPPAMAVGLIPGLSSILTGYLPSAVLKGCEYLIPFAMLGMSKMGGSISKSKEEIKACNMVFYFLVGNVFFLSLISGSLLDEIGESFSHPSNFPSHLASAVSAQADFFVTYILTDGLSGFSLEILQPALLTWDAIVLHTWGRGKEENPYLFSLPFFRVIPSVSLSILIGVVYAIIAPLLLPFLVGYFCLGYVVYMNQIQDVYETSYETCGQFWPYIHHYIIVGIALMQVTMIGLFGLKSKPAASIATIPLLVLTLIFNEYCKLRFLPTFRHNPVQDAAELDELDQKNGELETNYQNASTAYEQPSLRAVNTVAPEPSYTSPSV